jgi:long-chain fatty acid transport protein
MSSLRYLLAFLVPVACAAALQSGAAVATEGYFQYGYGARQKALAGAGVADSRDATAVALNPAGLVDVDDQMNIAASLFRPLRGFMGSGEPGLTPLGDIDSGRNYFLIPNLAISRRLPGNPIIDVMALSLYANGGLNTEYTGRGSPTCEALFALPVTFGGPIGKGDGVFCNRKAKSDLNQAFLSLAVAKRLGSVSVGVAPIFALQTIKFDGLQLFEPFSAAPTAVSNNNYDVSYGGGVRAGIEFKATDHIRIGVAGTSRIWMSDFDSYRGLLADAGDFDIPPSLQAGLAIDVMPRVTLMADYRRIWYSVIKSINNPSTNILTAGINPANLLGGPDGPGFGWDDINIVKFGAEWRATQRLTFRGGFAYNEGPFSSRDVEVNILAPGIVQRHFTAGLSYELSNSWNLDLAGFYSPRETVTGSELAIPSPLGAIGNPNHKIEIQGQGGEVTLGVTYRFGLAEARLK